MYGAMLCVVSEALAVVARRIDGIARRPAGLRRETLRASRPTTVSWFVQNQRGNHERASRCTSPWR